MNKGAGGYLYKNRLSGSIHMAKEEVLAYSKTVLIPGFGGNFDLDKRLYGEIQKKGFYWK